MTSISATLLLLAACVVVTAAYDEFQWPEELVRRALDNPNCFGHVFCDWDCKDAEGKPTGNYVEEGEYFGCTPTPSPSPSETTCTEKADADAWAALGCIVAGANDGTTVTALGAQSPAAGFGSCTITCPVAGAFVVTAPATVNCVESTAATSTCTSIDQELYTLTTAASGGGTACTGVSTLCVAGDIPESTCTAKADADAWAALGCIVAGANDGATVTALGAQSAAAGFASCTITCPVDAEAFVVTAPGGTPSIKVASTTTLGGVPFRNLTREMKTTIEDKIIAQVGAESIDAEYSAGARRTRDRSLATGDTVVEWEATFSDASAASVASEAAVASFQTGLAQALEAEAAFSGVGVTTTTFTIPVGACEDGVNWSATGMGPCIACSTCDAVGKEVIVQCFPAQDIICGPKTQISGVTSVHLSMAAVFFAFMVAV